MLLSRHGRPRPEALEASVLYGEEGRPIAWVAADRSIYLFDGTPVAWISRTGDVHAWSGLYLGWFQDGALWDREGRCVLFSSSARGGPQKPVPQPEPARAVKRRRLERGTAEIPSTRPRRRSVWSDITDEGFFSPTI
jgi:hypothetical protein